MKIGIYASTFHKAGYGRYGENAYEKIRELGFDTSDLDICETDLEIYTLPQAKSDEIILKEKALADKAGIKIHQVHGPWRYPPRDATKEDRDERFEKMCISMRATALIGCKYWVIHPLMPFGTSDRDTPNATITRQINLEFFKKLVQEAKRYGVIICLENMPMLDFSISTPAEILSLVEEINDDHLQICLDTGHVNAFRELDVAEEIKRLGKRIRVLHVHDNVSAKDLHALPFFGAIEWKSVVRALKEIGFDGSFSVETTPPVHLPNDLFEQAGKLLVNILHHLVD